MKIRSSGIDRSRLSSRSCLAARTPTAEQRDRKREREREKETKKDRDRGDRQTDRERERENEIDRERKRQRKKRRPLFRGSVWGRVRVSRLCFVTLGTLSYGPTRAKRVLLTVLVRGLVRPEMIFRGLCRAREACLDHLDHVHIVARSHFVRACRLSIHRERTDSRTSAATILLTVSRTRLLCRRLARQHLSESGLQHAELRATRT